MNIFDEIDQFAKKNPSTKKKQSVPEQYRILNCTIDSSTKDIKESYHRLLKKYHPDVNKSSDAPENLRKVVEAYKKLQLTHRDPITTKTSPPKADPPPKPKPKKPDIYRTLINGAIYVDEWMFDFDDVDVCAMTPYGQEYVFKVAKSTKLPITVTVDGMKIEVCKEY